MWTVEEQATALIDKADGWRMKKKRRFADCDQARLPGVQNVQLYIFWCFQSSWERPHHDDSTASRSLCEVKHHRAQLVLRWGTTLESWVLFFCSFCFFILEGYRRLPSLFPLCVFLSFVDLASHQGICWISYRTCRLKTHPSFAFWAERLVFGYLWSP